MSIARVRMNLNATNQRQWQSQIHLPNPCRLSARNLSGLSRKLNLPISSSPSTISYSLSLRLSVRFRSGAPCQFLRFLVGTHSNSIIYILSYYWVRIYLVINFVLSWIFIPKTVRRCTSAEIPESDSDSGQSYVSEPIEVFSRFTFVSVSFTFIFIYLFIFVSTLNFPFLFAFGLLKV